ncbi:MAG TPA: UDP-N-acetylmuramoyl-tripeptide--D-alanyl-D-alanine ligase [Gammaproteobacteria bacterium]|nr:UDP-N-acetylmuramoyl-tripeptide--D-alanyl-D-alanine ligase [Gammaproteobacteria bacterium]
MRQPVAGLTTDFVARALGLAAPSGNRTFTGVTSDSRGDVAGSLFVAIRGERFDGHAFIDAAIAGGAAGVLVERNRIRGQAIAATVFPVDDTLAAWRTLAGEWRRHFDIPVVAVGGSAGKTTTKNLLAAMLRGRFEHVLATEGSRNGYLGLAMTLTALRAEHEAAVIEIGIDAPGAMAEHAELVRPGAALVTTIGVEHLETMGDIETVAAEECRLLTITAEQGGSVFIHDEDPRLRACAPDHAIRYGLNGEPDDRRLRGRIDGNGVVISGLGLDEIGLPLPLPGRHNALNVLAAAAVARGLGLDGEEIRAGLTQYRPDAARSNRVELRDGITVLADYYNASPLSMAAAFETLISLGERRRWLCLGDMLELGVDELSYHRALAAPIVEMDACGVLLYGPRMQALADALREEKFAGAVAHFDDKAALADTLQRAIEPGDAILIKGSRGMAMEDVMSQL